MSPRRGGPTPYLRLDYTIKVDQGVAVMQLVLGDRLTFRQAATALDMSLSTAWRRFWFVVDCTTPQRHGCKPGPLPPQRGTKACPRGRPWMPTYDGRPAATRPKGSPR
ncbi:hypothetical protein [Streptomyces canus]|uniref:hypothetical protein n=1 Tax=Streptomyces canus TaxID=58343 RepID=UPI00036A5872|nr:hypothetical protein [Streptomyces canus]